MDCGKRPTPFVHTGPAQHLVCSSYLSLARHWPMQGYQFPLRIFIPKKAVLSLNQFLPIGVTSLANPPFLNA